MYRLSKAKKILIAQNLIDIFQKDKPISKDAKGFIANWMMSGPEEKGKAFYDVWEIVLKNFLPSTRPILFRACPRISKNGKIASFSGRIEFSSRYSKRKGSMIICDTRETLQHEEVFYQSGNYRNTFYPIGELLKKAKEAGNWGFRDIAFSYIDEDEYIMRINLDKMYCLKWS